ncbi:hypothetical protein DFJ74DRAFT_248548 [Hyaloraphidium curvatum]|nr:hypothetical protein DFJ74DRAFT_248548 [Hyaloraphidium curvatum]
MPPAPTPDPSSPASSPRTRPPCSAASSARGSRRGPQSRGTARSLKKNGPTRSCPPCSKARTTPRCSTSGAAKGSLLRRLVAPLLAGKEARLVGVNPSGGLVPMAGELAAAEGLAMEFKAGTAEDAGVHDADAVLCVTVTLHVADPAALVESLFRCVKPGGVVALFDQDFTTLTVHLAPSLLPAFSAVHGANWRLRLTTGDAGRRLFPLLASSTFAVPGSAQATSNSNWYPGVCPSFRGAAADARTARSKAPSGSRGSKM